MNLINLEKMNATERMAEALQARGLFIDRCGEFLKMSECNTTEDIQMTRDLLQTLGIPVFWQQNQFQVLVNRIPIAMMKKIMNAPGREFPIMMNAYHYQWRAFAQRRFGIKVNALDLDANMAMLVKSLNLAGITSLAGCNGHHRYSPNVQLSGPFQGAWFEVIKKRYLRQCKLNYKWNVHYGNQSGAFIGAEKQQDENWNMNLIYQDTVQMAEIIQQNATEIRELKNTAFKRNREMKEAANQFAMKREYAGLVKWMEKKVNAVTK